MKHKKVWGSILLVGVLFVSIGIWFMMSLKGTGEKGENRKDQSERIILKTFTLNESTPHSLAISMTAYNRLNKENQVTYIEENNPLNQQNIQKLSVELLARNAPDLLELYGLPYESYLKQGSLYDMPLSDEDVAKFHPSIKRLFEEVGKKKVLPLQIMMPALFVNEDLLEEMGINFDFNNFTIKEFMELAETIKAVKPEGVSLIAKDTSHVLIDHMLQLLYYDTIKSGTPLTKEDLQELIANAKEVKTWEHEKFRWEVMKESRFDEKDQVIFIPIPLLYCEQILKGYTLYSNAISKKGYYYAEANVLLGVTNDRQIEDVEGFVSYMMQVSPQATVGRIPVTVGSLEKQKADSIRVDSLRKSHFEQIETMLNQVQGYSSWDIVYRGILDQIELCVYEGQEEAVTIENILRFIDLNQEY